ncbi:hypothetical protein Dda_5099 [Drechslerella dactyloides]|uniref:Uncharacterized protein n=1 Tax=Drechslerella dactyloides TaxID=74499 RepID=A0AAD6NIJ3_DREDA|nr:hypothetical protein Dda_5099 [Drechslerella dactyloides]
MRQSHEEVQVPSGPMQLRGDVGRKTHAGPRMQWCSSYQDTEQQRLERQILLFVAKWVFPSVAP